MCNYILPHHSHPSCNHTTPPQLLQFCRRLERQLARINDPHERDRSGGRYLPFHAPTECEPRSGNTRVVEVEGLCERCRERRRREGWVLSGPAGGIGSGARERAREIRPARATRESLRDGERREMEGGRRRTGGDGGTSDEGWRLMGFGGWT